MKKYVLTIILIVIMSVATISFFLVGHAYRHEKSINSKAKLETKTLITETENSKVKLESITEELDKLKESSKEKLEDQEIWKKAKDKLTKAL